MISLDKDAGTERLSSNSLPPDQASERHDELEGLTDEQEPQDVREVESVVASTNLLESSSSSSSTSSSEESLGEVADRQSSGIVSAEAVVQNWKPKCDVFKNRKTKTLHLLPVGSTKATFLCGRRLTSDSIQFEGTIFHDSWKCRQCDTSVKRRQGDVPWDAVHRTLKL